MGRMNFYTGRDAATMNVEQPTLPPAVPFKMNFYIERDSLITEPEAMERKSEDSNTKSKCKKTESNSIIKKNYNFEKDPTNRDTANAKKTISSAFKLDTSTSSPISSNKDLNNDEKKSYAKKISKIWNAIEKRSKRWRENDNRCLIKFIKPVEEFETDSTQEKYKTDQLFNDENDYSCLPDRILQPVKELIVNDDQKVNLSSKALNNKKKKKKEVPSFIQLFCETCKYTKKCKTRRKKCSSCDEQMKYQCQQCNSIVTLPRVHRCHNM